MKLREPAVKTCMCMHSTRYAHRHLSCLQRALAAVPPPLQSTISINIVIGSWLRLLPQRPSMCQDCVSHALQEDQKLLQEVLGLLLSTLEARRDCAGV